VIESFRNDLWPGYKTSEGVAPELLRQFHPLEDALKALGVRVWPMVELEADDALAAAAATAAADPGVRRVFICTPDKDLSQCVEGDRVVMLDRRSGNVRDEAGVIERFGVPPSSIPDWLGLVGDSSDGYPGIAGWGEKSAGRVLARYRHLESIPKAVKDWEVDVRGAARLAESLFGNWEAALLFRHLATVRSSAPVLGSVAELAWQGPLPQLEALAMKLDAEAILRRAQSLAQRRGVLTP